MPRAAGLLVDHPGADRPRGEGGMVSAPMRVEQAGRARNGLLPDCPGRIAG